MKKAVLIPGLFCVAAMTFAFPGDAKARVENRSVR
jgi:hypothetical protein